MPYAPGISYRAGDYFAAAGPRINDNIQNYLRNREERQQAVTSAEMIGRYLGDDPQFHEKFGEQFQKAPGMSTGALKGLVGSATMFMTQRHLKAAEDAQAAQTDIAKQELALRAGEAAAKLEARKRLASFSEQIGQEINPPLMFKSAAGEGPGPLTPETVARIAGPAGVFGEPEVTALYNAVSNYAQRIEGVPAGQAFRTQYGTVVTGRGRGVAPDVQYPKEVTPPKGFPTSYRQETPEGVIQGMGEQNAPEFTKKDGKPKLDSSALQIAQSLATFGQQLDSAEADVDKFGHDWIRSAEGKATLDQLPTLLATGYYKATDPSSIVSSKEVDKFRNDLFPQGKFTRVEVTKAALENLRKLTAFHANSWSAAHGDNVPGLPNSILIHTKTVPTVQFKSPEDVKASNLSREMKAQILREQFGFE